jgi:hypothetical protein
VTKEQVDQIIEVIEAYVAEAKLDIRNAESGMEYLHRREMVKKLYELVEASK